MSNVEQIEVSIEEAKKQIERKKWAEKLTSNREFKRLVLEGYFNEEAARLAGLTADPAMKEYRDDVFVAIQAISMFRQYMQNIIRIGETMEAELQEYEEALEEARNLEDEVA